MVPLHYTLPQQMLKTVDQRAEYYRESADAQQVGYPYDMPRPHMSACGVSLTAMTVRASVYVSIAYHTLHCVVLLSILHDVLA